MKSILKICSLVSFVLVSVYVSAQDKANFSGSWVLNESKSTFGEGPMGRGGASQIVIAQDAAKIECEKTSKRRNGEEFKQKETITLDGKVSENQAFGNNTKKSTAEWSKDGKSLVIKSTMTMERNGNTMEINTTETYKFSEDLKNLVLESISTTPRGEMKLTLVYDKK
jgi:hypothetical protein